MNGEHICADCGTKCTSERGLAVHKKRAHAGGTGEADELFVKVGSATRALFPDGIPAERVIEIAEVQKAMLKVLTR